MTKYNIGQMVVLSSAGRQRGHNPQYVRSGFGLVLGYKFELKFPYQIKWYSQGQVRDFSAKEYEIKKIKVPKRSKNVLDFPAQQVIL